MLSMFLLLLGGLVLVAMLYGLVALNQYRQDGRREEELRRFLLKMKAAEAVAKEYQVAARLLTEPPRNEGTARVVEKVRVRTTQLHDDVLAALKAEGINMPKGWNE